MQELNPEAGELECFLVSEAEAGERIDKLLSTRFAGVQSRQYFQRLISDGYVRVNGADVKKKDKPLTGDEIEVQFVLTPEIALDPEPIPLDILYEDEQLIAVNKPAGMVVHPAPGNWRGTFVNALLHHCITLDREQSPLRPGIVHRLDKETTGVLLAAKTNWMHQRLVGLFQGRQMRKEYLAIVVGNPGDGEVNAAIGRHPVHRKQMTVVAEGGRQARTLYHTLKTSGELSLVRLQLVTGRTHQARVHMRHLGHPILGDPVYGNTGMNTKYRLQRQMLHAALLSFQHPETQQTVVLEAPLPADMQRIAEEIS